jgi:hypothetical protein
VAVGLFAAIFPYLHALNEAEEEKLKGLASCESMMRYLAALYTLRLSLP